MNISEASKILMNGIETDFENHGFKPNKNNREFKRVVGDAVQRFRLFFYKEGGQISIKPEVSIEIRPIEDIYRKVSSIKGRPYHTMGNHLFEILRYLDLGEEIGKGTTQDWAVQNKENIDYLIQVIPKYLEESIIPYFDENSSLSRVDELLNKYPRELSVHNYIYPLRANIAVIAAKLNKNPKYEELLSLYEEELEEAEETYKTEFYDIKEYLGTLD